MPLSPIKKLNLAPPKVDVENLADGGMILRSPQPLKPYPDSLGVWLIDWAARTPDAVFVADRTGENGDWRRLGYAEFLAGVRAIGQSLLGKGLSAERPVAILSDNGVDNALLLFAAMHVGIPAVPVSPAYSLMSRDFGKLKHIVEQITPGLVFADSGEKFAAALDAVDFGDAEIVTGEAFNDLYADEVTGAVDDAFAEVGPDTIAKILFTSGSSSSS